MLCETLMNDKILVYAARIWYSHIINYSEGKNKAAQYSCKNTNERKRVFEKNAEIISFIHILPVPFIWKREEQERLNSIQFCELFDMYSMLE